MLLKQMKYFVTIVECHSFTEAAELCFISQSAISQRMKALEEELDVQLIIRENRKFSLTPAGEYFYRHCLGILDEIERVKSETIQIGKYDDQHLKIGFLKNFGGHEIRKAISEFSELYPEVTLDIMNGTHEELYDVLRFGEVDAVLNDHRRAFSQAYVNYHLVTSKCYIELSPKNPLSQLEYVTYEDLRRLPCILVTSKEQQEHESDYYQNTLGYGGNFLYALDLESARLMVAANKGFMPVEDSTHIQESTTIKRIPLYQSHQQLTRNYCLFWKKEKTGYYIEEFADILHKIFEEHHD